MSTQTQDTWDTAEAKEDGVTDPVGDALRTLRRRSENIKQIDKRFWARDIHDRVRTAVTRLETMAATHNDTTRSLTGRGLPPRCDHGLPWPRSSPSIRRRGRLPQRRRSHEPA